jgi:hypothetical protein
VATASGTDRGFDDVAADPGRISAPEALTATEGTRSDGVELAWSAASATSGRTHTYQVIALNESRAPAMSSNLAAGARAAAMITGYEVARDDGDWRATGLRRRSSTRKRRSARSPRRPRRRRATRVLTRACASCASRPSRRPGPPCIGCGRRPPAALPLRRRRRSAFEAWGTWSLTSGSARSAMRTRATRLCPTWPEHTGSTPSRPSVEAGSTGR